MGYWHTEREWMSMYAIQKAILQDVECHPVCVLLSSMNLNLVVTVADGSEFKMYAL